MCDKKISPVEFDYTSFLGASCSKKWTFLEALTSVAPVFGEAWKESTKNQNIDPDSRLWEKALSALSSRRSDESNLVALMKIARKENIACLKVVMPYSLESEQIQLIQDKGNVKIVVIPNEDILIAEFH
ncbi:transporter [Vibrio mediterranei]|jgi:hypothetical protein